MEGPEKEEVRVWGNGGFEKGGKELTSLGHWRGFKKEEESGKSLDGRRLEKRRKGVERPCAKRRVLKGRKGSRISSQPMRTDYGGDAKLYLYTKELRPILARYDQS